MEIGKEVLYLTQADVRAVGLTMKDYIDLMEEGERLVPIVVYGGGVLTAEALQVLADQGIGFSITLADDSDTILAILTCEQIERADDFDFTFLDGSPIEASAGRYFDEAATLYLSFAGAGSFPGPLKITLLNDKGLEQGVRKQVYVYNQETGRLDRLDSAIAMTADGRYIQFEAAAGRDFLLTTDIPEGEEAAAPAPSPIDKEEPRGSIWWILLPILGGVILLAGGTAAAILLLRRRRGAHQKEE